LIASGADFIAAWGPTGEKWKELKKDKELDA